MGRFPSIPVLVVGCQRGLERGGGDRGSRGRGGEGGSGGDTPVSARAATQDAALASSEASGPKFYETLSLYVASLTPVSSQHR